MSTIKRADRAPDQLPDHGQLPRLHPGRGQARRDLDRRRPPLLPFEQRHVTRLVRPLLGDQPPTGLPATKRLAGARLRPLPAHRRRHLPQCAPAAVPESGAPADLEGLAHRPPAHPARGRQQHRHRPQGRWCAVRPDDVQLRRSFSTGLPKGNIFQVKIDGITEQLRPRARRRRPAERGRDQGCRERVPAPGRQGRGQNTGSVVLHKRIGAKSKAPEAVADDGQRHERQRHRRLGDPRGRRAGQARLQDPLPAESDPGGRAAGHLPALPLLQDPGLLEPGEEAVEGRREQDRRPVRASPGAEAPGSAEELHERLDGPGRRSARPSTARSLPLRSSIRRRRRRPRSSTTRTRRGACSCARSARCRSSSRCRRCSRQLRRPTPRVCPSARTRSTATTAPSGSVLPSRTAATPSTGVSRRRTGRMLRYCPTRTSTTRSRGGTTVST